VINHTCRRTDSDWRRKTREETTIHSKWISKTLTKGDINMENPTTTSDLSGNDPQAAQPNIIMIMVDQMRFPMHLPPGIANADKFIEKYMPNLFKYIWSKGVRFANHYIAASDCTAGRATIYTGLYAYQTYSMLTLITFPQECPLPDSGEESVQQGLFQPQLQEAFPTIGHLLRDAGYDTPYFGKWHLSYCTDDLERYGFDSHTPPDDYPGLNGQGLEDDDTIAGDAAGWVNERVESKNTKPFFLSVNFVNPHDKQFFWGGMQVDDFKEVYNSIPVTPPEQPAQKYDHEVAPEDAPPSYGYPQDVREFLNWESKSQLEAKPGVQTLVKEVFQYQMGGFYEDEEASTYTPVSSLEPEKFWYAPTQLQEGKHKAIAAYEYWSKALDSYIQVQQMVDESIGKFMESIPEEIRENAVFVFTSDHGEYASSHGLQGKGGTIYEEGILTPFVVYDPKGRFTASTEQYRTQMTSSVDLLPMIVSMAHGGADNWMQENADYQQLYQTRCDLLNILRDADAPGRQYVLHTTDEFVPSTVNYLDAPMHVIGTIFKDEEGNKQKLGIYTTWAKFAGEHSHAVVNKNIRTQIEYYDHSTEGGAREMHNTPHSEKAQEAIERYWGNYPDGSGLVLEELQATLPVAYQEAQQTAYRQLRQYMLILDVSAAHSKHEESDQSDPSLREKIQERVSRLWAY
jgi:arylsulfatase A-like enzyme